jgi:hypothetical protein
VKCKYVGLCLDRVWDHSLSPVSRYSVTSICILVTSPSPANRDCPETHGKQRPQMAPNALWQIRYSFIKPRASDAIPSGNVISLFSIHDTGLKGESSGEGEDFLCMKSVG